MIMTDNMGIFISISILFPLKPVFQLLLILVICL